MLLSELEERGRRFKLALRAAIPILLLVALVLYATFFKGGIVDLGVENKLLIVAIVFITVYFIYFFIERSAQETLIDPATHGFTEKAFIDTVKKAHPDTFIMIVIDNLYLLNQNYSTEQVELLLYSFTHKLDAFFRQQEIKNALIARRYGAEFLIALKSDDTTRIKKMIQTFIDQHDLIDNIELDYRHAIVIHTDHQYEKVIGQLRNVIAINEENTSSNKETMKDSRDLNEIEQSVVHAMKHQELSLSFRPLLNLHTDEIDIYEIAVKLKHPQKGDILPRVYLPIINRMGLGRDYDMMLVKYLLKLLPLVDAHISFTFNLSPFSLRDRQFQEQFFKLLETSKIDASRLIVQLYERKTHHNLSSYLRTLNQIRAHGVRICIDNFGSSNASMEYMKHFKFDMVQFDRDYVTKLEDKTTLAMLESLVNMSKEIDITTVAKWVDKSPQRKTLTALGVDYLQGFGIAKAIDEFELIEYYNKGKQ